MQSAINTVLYCAWLGGLESASQTSTPELGRLLTLEEVGTVFKGPSPSSLDFGSSNTNSPYQSQVH